MLALKKAKKNKVAALLRSVPNCKGLLKNMCRKKRNNQSSSLASLGPQLQRFTKNYVEKKAR